MPYLIGAIIGALIVGVLWDIAQKSKNANP